jgi:hypothetical protein
MDEKRPRVLKNIFNYFIAILYSSHISVISWWSVLLMEETRVTREMKEVTEKLFSDQEF